MQKKLLIILTVVLIIVGQALKAQNSDIKRTWHWYFGDWAGLDFSGGHPVAVTNGQMGVNNGNYAASDTNGNLLFYGDGISIWNRNHQLMPNGNGLPGTYMNIQAIEIMALPKPGDDNIYYVFTEVADQSLTRGMRIYAIVDMTQDGGLGDVINKANLLRDSVNENITCTLNREKTGVWIMLQDFFTNKYYAYLFTSTGINNTPVISAGGPSNLQREGAMKFSPDGKKLAVNNRAKSTVIFDFDNKTGILSNPLIFPHPNNNGSIGCGTMDLEFSPDGKKLYITVYCGTGYQFGNATYQYHLTGDSASTINSMTLLDTAAIIDSAATDLAYGFTAGLQIGADGIIYGDRIRTSHLAAITNPDILGTGCNFVDSAVYLQGRFCENILTEFPPYYFYFDSLYSHLSEVILVKKDKLLIFPNPFSTQANLILQEQVGGILKTIEIYNLLGQKVTGGFIIKQTENNNYYIISRRKNIPEGIYIITFLFNNKSYSQKLIITN